MVLGYCIVCKATRELTDLQQILRSGLPAIEGKCTACGSQTFVLGAQVSAADDTH